jgi:hypothetical protein
MNVSILNQLYAQIYTLNKIDLLLAKILSLPKNLSKMNPLQTIIEQAWENRALLQETTTTDAIREVIELLDTENYVLPSQLAKDGK